MYWSSDSENDFELVKDNTDDDDFEPTETPKPEKSKSVKSKKSGSRKGGSTNSSPGKKGSKRAPKSSSDSCSATSIAKISPKIVADSDKEETAFDAEKKESPLTSSSESKHSQESNSESLKQEGTKPSLDDYNDADLSILRARENELIKQMNKLKVEIRGLEKKLGIKETDYNQSIADQDSKSGENGQGDADNSNDNNDEEFKAPEWCIPIKANVMNFDWESLGAECQFDVITMDPPWQLASQAPTRGVAIAYQQLPDVCIESLPIEKLQTNGFLFIWVINNKYTKSFELIKKWGYKYVDEITWVKQTVNRRMAKGHGYYLQHAKETCLVGLKGDAPAGCQHSVASDVIFSERRGQSQKPEELYEIIEQLVPNGKYLEIFGRKNNLRDYWVTVGNEL
ncbi:hypothetical protein H4219_004357 [Mycoemilia scoparia]|uniref:mRNA m(6)A methyltransferase n=1 Tax=Mycoemilia scoparia TaxID=417184 RepID=A0A9W7ZSU3_9FUNG|nr:hypothetical protein H4219_004357 [Mycoemilia scoparia]